MSMPRAPQTNNEPEYGEQVAGTKRSYTPEEETGERGKTSTLGVAVAVGSSTSAGKGHVAHSPTSTSNAQTAAITETSTESPKPKPHARAKGKPHAVKATVEYPGDE